MTWLSPATDSADGNDSWRRQYVELDEVAAIATAFSHHAEKLPPGELAVLDLYIPQREQAPSLEGLAGRLRALLAEVPTPPALHRIVVAAAEPRRGRGMSAIDLFTFRPGPSGLVEDKVLRGLHPMMGDRLQLWRLREFDLERLASPEDIYMFHGVARANAKDGRLFALAEVRDLTPVHDERGRAVSLPEFERVLVSVLEAIRGFQARRPLHRRLMWNRVLLHCVAGDRAEPRRRSHGRRTLGAPDGRTRDRAGRDTRTFAREGWDGP